MAPWKGRFGWKLNMLALWLFSIFACGGAFKKGVPSVIVLPSLQHAVEPDGDDTDPLPLDMAPKSVDDMYDGCQEEMKKLISTSYLDKETNSNTDLKKAWTEAEKYYDEKWGGRDLAGLLARASGEELEQGGRRTKMAKGGKRGRKGKTGKSTKKWKKSKKKKKLAKSKKNSKRNKAGKKGKGRKGKPKGKGKGKGKRGKGKKGKREKEGKKGKKGKDKGGKRKKTGKDKKKEKDSGKGTKENNSTAEIRREQIIALYAYSLSDISSDFNTAVRNERSVYKSTFKYHALHFFLTDAIQTLNARRPTGKNSMIGYLRMDEGFGHDSLLNQDIRFGAFMSASSSDYPDAEKYGDKSCFQIQTNFGADVSKYTKPGELAGQLLIPPYEVFTVTKISERSEDESLPCEVVYNVESKGEPLSNLNCDLVT